MIYILLPVHNRCDITKNFILDLTNQIYKHFQLILIDDGSTDGTSEMVKSFLPDTFIIQGKGNLWWGGSLDKAYRYIKKIKPLPRDLILIINDDTRIDPNFLNLANNLLRDKNNILIKAQGYNFENNLIDTGVNIDWSKFSFRNTEIIEEINCLSTRGLFMHVEDFLSIGGFYPKLLPHYTSDYEYTYRAYKKGFKLTIDPNLKLFFNDKTTGIKLNYSKEKSFFNFMKNLLSKRSIDNPFIFCIFIIISSPFKFKLQNILRVLKRSILLFRYK